MNLQALYPQLKEKFYVEKLTDKTPVSALYSSDWLDYLKKYLSAKKILESRRPGLEHRKLTTEVNVLESLTRKHRANMKHFYSLRKAEQKTERKTRKEK